VQETSKTISKTDLVIMHRQQTYAQQQQQRHPFSDAAHAVNHGAPIPSSPPLKHAQKAQNPGSPPLPRQNTKTTPPSPPQVIKDRGRAVEFLRIALLGEVSGCAYLLE
jgi:hypothetical protein